MHKFLLLFLMLPLASAAQATKKDSINTYYKLQRAAGLHITEARYDSALALYQEAMQYRTLFCADSYDACICAVKLGRYADAVVFAGQMVKKGVPMSFFEKNPAIAPLTRQPEWKDYIATKPRPKYDAAWRRKVENLYVKDQRWRADARYQDSIAATEEMIYNKLTTMFKERGYPSEEKIGVWLSEEDTLLNTSWNPLELMMANQLKKNPAAWVNALEAFVYDGSLHNETFLVYAGHFGTDDRYAFRCIPIANADAVQIGGDLYACCCKKEAQINTNRARYFLGNLAYALKMMDFKMRGGHSFCIGQSPFSHPDATNPESIVKLKAALKKEGLVLYRKLE
jgi:hypothetical protein